MKIYIVTSGEYSAYRIDAVFSTRELAEAFFAGQPNEIYRIEEFDVDQAPSLRWVTLYEIFWKNGQEPEFKESIAQANPHSRGLVYSYSNGYIGGFSEISREHAFKLAVEERQRLLRTNP